MDSMAASSFLFLLIAAAFAAGASATMFTITSSCSFPVWPVITPGGSSLRLDPGHTWAINLPSGNTSCKIWGRTGCSFTGNTGSCQTGDCGGTATCTGPGQPPVTLAEFTLVGGGAQNFYDISVINGFNIGMAVTCSTGEQLVCSGPDCPVANRSPSDMKTHVCNANSSFQVMFCPTSGGD